MKTITISGETHARLQLAALREVLETAARILTVSADRELEIEGNRADLIGAVECYMALAFTMDDIPQSGAPIAPEPYCAHGVRFSETCEHCAKPDPFAKQGAVPLIDDEVLYSSGGDNQGVLLPAGDSCMRVGQ